MTDKIGHAIRPKFMLQERFLSVLVAICTQGMKWGAGLFWICKKIGERSGTEFGKLVCCLLGIPSFKVSNLFFKIAYGLNQRRALLIRRKNAALGFEDCALQFDDL